MIERPFHRARVEALLRQSRVVALVGARQVGKTTLARQIAARRDASWFDLESVEDVARLADPMLALGSLRGLVVLDEVQRVPDLFQALRVLADRPRGARFLVLGSASPALLQQASESLAGRLALHELGGLELGEVGAARGNDLWVRGCFPRAFTAPTLAESMRWRRDFIETFVQRDLPQLGVRVPSPTLRRFWAMLAHVHGQILNWSELGRAMDVTDMTVRRYLDVLAETYVVRTLAPFHENISKRQVKAPKVYVRDSGLLHALLDIVDRRDLDRHPKVGASWEGFAVEALIAHLRARPSQCHFWATHAGAELDLLVVEGRRRRGFEVKRTVAPRLTPSMRTALADLSLASLDVIHAGAEVFPIAARVRAVPLGRITGEIEPVRG